MKSIALLLCLLRSGTFLQSQKAFARYSTSSFHDTMDDDIMANSYVLAAESALRRYMRQALMRICTDLDKQAQELQRAYILEGKQREVFDKWMEIKKEHEKRASDLDNVLQKDLPIECGIRSFTKNEDDKDFQRLYQHWENAKYQAQLIVWAKRIMEKKQSENK